MQDIADVFLLNRAGGVLSVTFNRPALGNGLSPLMVGALASAFEAVMEDRAVRRC